MASNVLSPYLSLPESLLPPHRDLSHLYNPYTTLLNPAPGSVQGILDFSLL